MGREFEEEGDGLLGGSLDDDSEGFGQSTGRSLKTPQRFKFVLTEDSPYSRLYSKGRILGHKRAKRNTRPNTTLVQIEGVSTKEEAQFYLGKVRHVTLFNCTTS